MKGPQEEFLDYLRAGRFMLQRVKATGRHVFYPRHLMPDEGPWDWVDAQGSGTVYSRTIIRQKPERGGDYCIALVDLAEGPRLLTRILDVAPEEVRIGMAVQARVGPGDWGWDETPVVAFVPAAPRDKVHDGA